jgi:hypothetical protein
MKCKGIGKILSGAIAVLAVLSINACGTRFPQNPRRSAFQMYCGGSACLADGPEAHVALLSPKTGNTRAVNDYLVRCGEQARMVHHEIQNCRAITVITVPLDYGDSATVPHTHGRGPSDFENPAK